MNDRPSNVVPLTLARRRRELARLTAAAQQARRTSCARTAAPEPNLAARRFDPRASYRLERCSERRHQRALAAALTAAMLAAGLLAISALLLRF
jgi:hypothetical protein